MIGRFSCDPPPIADDGFASTDITYSSEESKKKIERSTTSNISIASEDQTRRRSRENRAEAPHAKSRTQLTFQMALDSKLQSDVHSSESLSRLPKNGDPSC